VTWQNNLTERATGFIGRRHEIKDVLAPWLAHDANLRAIAITGASGIGKTHLALAVAAEHRASFPGGVLLVEAGDDPGFGLETLLCAMDAAWGTRLCRVAAGMRPAFARVHLNARRHLLILDDLDRAPADGVQEVFAFLRTLDAGPGGVLAMITAENVPAPVRDLAPYEQFRLSRLDAPEAETLARQMARQILGPFNELDGHEREIAVKGCDGHPFLIAQVIGLMQHLDRSQVEQHLQALPNNTSGRIAALIQAHVDRLDSAHPLARRVLWSLGAFTGGATPEIVACVQAGIDAGAKPRRSFLRWRRPKWQMQHQNRFLAAIDTAVAQILDEQALLAQTREALDVLRRGQLVNRVGDRYALHPLVRDFVLARAWDARQDGPQSFAHSHTIAYLHYAASHHHDDGALTEALPNIQAAFARATAERHERAIFFFSWWMSAFFDTCGHWQTGLRWATQFVNVCRRLRDRSSLGYALATLAGFHRRLGQHALALDTYRKAVRAKKRGHERPESLANSYADLATLYLDRGKHRKALRWAKKSVRIHDKLSDYPGLIADYDTIGKVYQARGKGEEALQWLQKSLSLAEAIGDQVSVATGANKIGEIHAARGDDVEALGWFKRSLAAASESGELATTTTSSNNIGQLHHKHGAYSNAQAWFKRSLSSAETSGDLAGVATGHNNMASIPYVRGNYERALTGLHHSLDIAEAIDSRAKLAAGYHNLGQVHLARGQAAAARDWFERSLSIATEIGDKRVVQRCREGLAKAQKRA
jgi:tetratricopeptide (TPR) repeat protein